MTARVLPLSPRPIAALTVLATLVCAGCQQTAGVAAPGREVAPAAPEAEVAALDAAAPEAAGVETAPTEPAPATNAAPTPEAEAEAAAATSAEDAMSTPADLGAAPAPAPEIAAATPPSEASAAARAPTDVGARARAARRIDPVKLGVRLLEANQPEMALKAFNRALAEDGPKGAALTGAAVANLRIGRRGAAEKLLRSAVRIAPDYAAAHNNLGVTLYDAGDYQAALLSFRHALKLTGGRDAAIATNLSMTEFALADRAKIANADEAALDEAEFDVILYGNGVYKLEPRRPEAAAAGRAAAEPAAAESAQDATETRS